MLKDIIVTYLLPLLIYGFITGAANLALAHKSQIESWAETHPGYAGFLKLMRAVGFDPWNLVSAVSLWAKKRLPDAQQNGKKAVAALVEAESLKPPPTDDDDTPKWPRPPAAPVIGFLLFALFAAHTSACKPDAPPCSPQNATYQAKLAECAARRETECKGLADEDCPMVAECDEWIEERCK